MNNHTTPASAAATSAHLNSSAFSIRCNTDWLRDNSKLKGATFKVYAAIISRMRDNPTAWPSHACLKKDTGYSIPTVKRALNTLRDMKLLNWNNRFEPTESGKMGQISNEYFFPKNELPPQFKPKPRPRKKRSDRTLKVEDFKEEQTNTVPVAMSVDDAISSPVLDEPTTSQHSESDLQAWEEMLIAARLSRQWARTYARSAGPEVPRIIEWWKTVDKLKLKGVGLLVKHLKTPALLPIAAAPEVKDEPDVQNAASRDMHGSAAQPSIPLTKEQAQERARQRIATLLRPLETELRQRLELGMADMSLKQCEDYLAWTMRKEWEAACRIVDEGAG